MFVRFKDLADRKKEVFDDDILEEEDTKIFDPERTRISQIPDFEAEESKELIPVESEIEIFKAMAFPSASSKVTTSLMELKKLLMTENDHILTISKHILMQNRNKWVYFRIRKLVIILLRMCHPYNKYKKNNFHIIHT